MFFDKRSIEEEKITKRIDKMSIILKILFGSPAKYRLLRELFAEDKTLYSSQIADLINMDRGQLTGLIKRLKDCDLITEEGLGGMVVIGKTSVREYAANKDNPYYEFIKECVRAEYVDLKEEKTS